MITIFLASSEELENDRKEFELFINRGNKQFHADGIFIRLEVWEDFIDRMSKTRMQDEYNKAAMNSDVFISLFWTKVGKYTFEEFKKAWEKFQDTGRPFIYAFYKNEPVKPNEIKQEDINSKIQVFRGIR